MYSDKIATYLQSLQSFHLIFIPHLFPSISISRIQQQWIRTDSHKASGKCKSTHSSNNWNCAVRAIYQLAIGRRPAPVGCQRHYTLSRWLVVNAERLFVAVISSWSPRQFAHGTSHADSTFTTADSQYLHVSS